MVTTSISPLSSQNSVQTPEVKLQPPPKTGGFNKLLVNEKNKLDHAMKQEGSRGISKHKLRAEMHTVRKASPTLEESYNSAMEHINTNELDEGGTKIALKRLAKQFGRLLASMAWKSVPKETASLAEKLWTSELTTALLEGDEELNDFEEHIYIELLEEWKIKNKIVGK